MTAETPAHNQCANSGTAQAACPVRVGPFAVTRRRCHRRTVPGVISRCIRSFPRGSRISAARTARSAQSGRGRGLVRRRTAASCRSTSNSMSLDAGERPSSTSQPQSRMKIRESRRRDTAEHHGLLPTLVHRCSSQARQTSGTPHVPQHQDLRIFRGAATRKQRQPAEQPDYEQVDKTKEHELRG